MSKPKTEDSPVRNPRQPPREAPAPGREPTRPEPVSDRASLTILVVDDDEEILTAVAELLRRSGYRVLTARDTPEAMTALHENPGIALLFTDIKMPMIDGLMLADMAKVRRPDLKVLYGTGFADYVSTQQGVRYGRILDKPYDPEQLCEEVRSLLGA